MESYLIWVIIGVALAIIEIFTAGFGVIFFSIGAFAAAVGAACSVSLNWQIGIFLIVSIATFVSIRPFAKKWLDKRNPSSEMNADALIGKHCVVTTAITEGVGEVQIDGDIWRAKSLDNSEIAVGEHVEVVSRDSIILTVKKLYPLTEN